MPDPKLTDTDWIVEQMLIAAQAGEFHDGSSDARVGMRAALDRLRDIVSQYHNELNQETADGARPTTTDGGPEIRSGEGADEPTPAGAAPGDSPSPDVRSAEVQAE